MSTKPPQVLVIDPETELRFRGPFTDAPITSYMKLKNPTEDQKVYFKIKTTAPKRYCVRPNSGIIKPQEICEVAVCLQPYEFDPNDKNKHKFMVQSIAVPLNDPDEDPSDIWKDVNQNQLMDIKLKCVFENPTVNPPDKSKTSTTNVSKSKAESNSTEIKNETVNETVELYTKPVDENDAKYAKILKELGELKVEEKLLRFDNLQLKEEVMKWKNAAMGKDTSLASMSGLSSTQVSNPLSMSTTSIIIAVAMVVVGYLLGKMI